MPLADEADIEWHWGPPGTGKSMWVEHNATDRHVVWHDTVSRNHVQFCVRHGWRVMITSNEPPPEWIYQITYNDPHSFARVFVKYYG